METGIWIDSFYYEGEDPDAEVNTDECNGTVYSKEDLEDIIHDIKHISMKSGAIYKKTDEFLAELLVKLEAGHQLL